VNATRRQAAVQGKSMIEFLLIAPVLLTIAGGTIEVSNYMRANQIATVMSQEIANSTYRQCADITLVQSAPNSSTQIVVDVDKTTRSVQTCLMTIQSAAQTNLAALLPGLRTQVRVAAFRTNSSSLDLNDSGCTGLTALGTAAPSLSSNSAGTSHEKYRSKDRRDSSDEDSDPVSEYYRQVLTVNNQAIMREGEVLVSAESACHRKNIVVSEVTVEVPRVVKFVPRLIPGGKNRATTTL
jgi:Flp pilus assembly protein TadG